MVNMEQNQYNMYVLGKCKDLIIKQLEANNDVKALIIGENNPTHDLRNENVFDTLIIELQTDVKTYITMETTISAIDNEKIKSVEIILNIFAHLKMIKLSKNEQGKYYTSGYFGNRIDVLLDMISRNLINSTNFGTNSLKLIDRNPIGIIQPKTDYYGKSVKFHVNDVHNWR